MPTLGRRARRFWHRHRTFFWILHSFWALATGVVVLYLARERYGFLPWVVAFMGLTWLSTLFFGQRTARTAADDADDDAPAAPGLLEEVTSYLTRIMYQETLFFLLPFYAYSTVWRSPNVIFLLLLGALAVVSCLDLVFDRWLRASPVFGLVFFSSVAFAGLNLVLPLLFALSPRTATPLAAAGAVGAAAVLGWRATSGTAARARLVLAGVTFMAVSLLAPSLVPPVPVRLESAVFTRAIDRSTLTPADTLEGPVAAAALPDGLVLLVRVFAPSSLPTAVTVEWKRNGETLRTTREIELLAHEAGFRVWEALRPSDGTLAPGDYEAVLRTRGRRVFGVARIRVSGPPLAEPEGQGRP